MNVMDVIKIRRSLIKNLVLYGLIGGLAALVDFSVFYILKTHINISKFIANIISMHIGMLISFSLNAVINFNKTDKLLKRFLSYYIIILCGMALSSFVLWSGAYFIQSGNIVKVISIVIVASLQFIFNKIFTFKF